jgi:hypothetical protein
MDDVPAPPRRSGRLRVAMALWVLCYVLGWPAVAAAASASPWLGAQNAALLGTFSYVLSWVMLAVATWLGGAELVEISRDWVRGAWARIGR